MRDCVGSIAIDEIVDLAASLVKRGALVVGSSVGSGESRNRKERREKGEGGKGKSGELHIESMSGNERENL